MSRLNRYDILSEEEALKKRLEELRSRVNQLDDDITSLKQCSNLSALLGKVYEVREKLNQFEQALLRVHLKCCISSSVEVPEEVALSVSRLSEKRHGAIIVIERGDDVGAHIQGGVVIDAPVSALILESIFYPGTPLHDGAVIIRNSRMLKARVLLPLASHTPELEALGLGSRHRAALGLSQVCDALVIIVSEEKGWISMALHGQLYPNLGTFAFLRKLEDSLGDGIQ